MTTRGGPTWTEQHRHECEVRHVCGLPGHEARREYLDGIERKRGKPAADTLRADVRKVFEARKSAKGA